MTASGGNCTTRKHGVTITTVLGHKLQFGINQKIQRSSLLPDYRYVEPNYPRLSRTLLEAEGISRCLLGSPNLPDSKESAYNFIWEFSIWHIFVPESAELFLATVTTVIIFMVTKVKLVWFAVLDKGLLLLI